MTRNRVRRPFAVEVKQRNRSASAPPEQRSPSALWNLTDLAQPEPAPMPAPQKVTSAVAAAPVPSASRRVLPSLIAPPVTAEPEEAVAALREERLPRVRRVAPKAPRAETVKVRAETARSTPIVAPAVAPVASRPVQVQAQAPAGTVRARPPRTAEGLRIGERWKRRLPRVCW